MTRSSGCGDLGGNRILRNIALKIGELQFKLFKQMRASLGGLAEFVVAELGDLELQMRDQSFDAGFLSFGGDAGGVRF